MEQVPDAKPEAPERPRQEGEEKKDESQVESVDTIVLTETKEKDEASSQCQKQGPALLVTDSWRLANKSLVVTEISMPPSQESSSDSVFTDPEELAGAAEAAKTEVADTTSSSLLPTTYDAPKSREIEQSSITPPLGEFFTILLPLYQCVTSMYKIKYKAFQSICTM